MKFTFKILFVILSIACVPSGYSATIPIQSIATKDEGASIVTTPDKKILWVTDTHLKAVNRDTFINSIKNSACEAIFITGDIADSDLIETLRITADHITTPIYFILGNSDNAYGSRTKEIRQSLDTLTKEKKNLHYLHDTAIYFEPKNMIRDVKTAVVGIDGYADSWNVCETQRKLDLATFERNVQNAIAQGAKRIVILTHIPPFMTDCWYKGEVTSLKNAPHFSSSQSATLFLNLANEHPKVTFIVYWAIHTIVVPKHTQAQQP
ncbi:MAG: metallophosphoesterase [Pseudomonadota bacterium]